MEIKIAVIGLGYVGLPLARLFSTKYSTIGYDMNQKRVDELMQGKDSTMEVEEELLQKAINENHFKCTTDLEEIRKCNFYVVAVPTPVDDNNRPNLRPLWGASETIGKVISKGDVVNAKITHLENFGAFADIGCGIIALMPIDTISVSRIEHPKERFSVGMEIKAVIKSIENGRISLSHKELLGTWQENADKFVVGETIAGIVRSVESYGAFVELSPNLAGLAESKDGVKVGQQASVYIKSIIPNKMKIKLIIIDTFDYKYNPQTPEYFSEESHIDKFTYSPVNCEKLIETSFE